MKIVKKLFVLLIFLIIYNIPFVVNAEVCDKEDIANMRELVKNVTYEYKYVGELSLRSNLQTYDVWFNFYGLDGKVSIGRVGDNLFVHNASEHFNLQSGRSSFGIYYDTCAGMRIGTIDVNLKRFNEYSLRNECVDLWDEVDVCSNWYQGSITDEKFMKMIDEYNLKVQNHSMTIKDFFVKYFYYIIGIMVFLIVIWIVIIIRNIRKNRLD